jgi:intermediate peptidase
MYILKGLFDIPELKNEDGFNILKNHAMAQVDTLIEEAMSKNRNKKMVEIFDELSDTLCKVADMAEFIRIAHPNQEYVQAAKDACISISSVVEK